MKTLAFSAVAVAVLAIVVFAAGFLMPQARTGRAERFIAAPRASVVETILDVERQPDWRSNVRSVEIDGDEWVETTASGERIRFAWTERGPERLALRFSSDRGYTGSWRATLSDALGGTRLTIEERAEIPSPMGRVFARLFFDPAAFSRRYLDGLARRLERAG